MDIRKSLGNVPLPSFVGASVISSFVLFNLSFDWQLAACMILALPLIMLGIAKGTSSLPMFLMSLVLLLGQIVVWNWTDLSVALIWLLFLVQILLALNISGVIKIPIGQASFDIIPSIFIFLLLGIAGAYINLPTTVSPIPWAFLWSLGLSIVAFGEAGRRDENDTGATLSLVGTIICIIAAFSVQGSMLQLFL